MKLISISVWGSQTMYWEGALANAALYRSVYPGWVMRFYTDTENLITRKLEEYGCEVRVVENRGGIHGMFWRFLPASEPGIDAVIVRDADARLNVREAAAVAAWLQSGKAGHVMRDHPYHLGWPMPGGMWGVRGGVIPDIETKIARWGRWAKKLDDQHFLKEVIWPLIASDCVQHVCGPSPWGGEPFPAHMPFDGYVGQTYYEGNRTERPRPASSRSNRGRRIRDARFDSAPEIELLLACARFQLSRTDDEAVRRLLADNIDWTRFARKAMEHSLAPIAGRTFEQAAPDLVPPEILDAFRVNADQSVAANHAALNVLAGAAEALAQNGIEAVALASAVLTEERGDEGKLRPPGALELLLRASDRPSAAAVLEPLGYEVRGDEADRAAPSSTAGAPVVILRTRLVHTGAAPDFDAGAVRRRARVANIDGHNLLVPAPEDMLLILAIASGRELWRNIGAVYEVAALLKSRPSLAGDELLASARARGQGRPLQLALTLARRALVAPSAGDLDATARVSPAIERIALRVMARWRDQAQTRAHPMAQRFDELRLQDGLGRQIRYAARVLISSSRLVTRPAADIRNALGRLPIGNDSARRPQRWGRIRRWTEPPSIAALNWRLRRSQHARAVAERAVEADPKDWTAWRALGDALAALGHHHEAVGCYDRALALAPADGAASKGRAAALATLRSD